ncbi:MAG: ATP-binding protein [Firmicutes bacterium]|nr:ATP-binding protein [Bacillota bacterium]
MAITNYERVGKALELLRQGLAPFVEREFRHAYGGRYADEAARFLGDDRLNTRRPMAEWDAAALLKVMWDAWNEVFKGVLGFAERSLVSELRDWRNKWAHQEPFSSDDAYRALDSVARLLTAVSAPQAEEVERMKMELLRLRFDEQVRSEKRKAGGSLVEAAVKEGLKPWREVITPHPDVASGRYQQAEFAADLWQVYLGEGSDEYKNPVEFFRRTYLTEGLKRLLVNAVRRFSGIGGDPVVQLQTNFGGGKTHSMIALYHLFSGRPAAELPGAEEIIREAGVTGLPRVNRVVLVGNRFSPGNPVTKSDGTVIRTFWGELAWQLGYAAGGVEEARRAFEIIRRDDEYATNPGDRLRELFKRYGPCLILIDEWVAYARQLHDTADLPGGSFETQFTFAQALTESAKATNTLVVISLPASIPGEASPVHPEDVEVGGLRGREALHRLSNVIGRVEFSWRPASAEESFEIVRRRLFQPMTDPGQFKDRDVVARAFVEFYRSQPEEFPPECREFDYEQRIKAAYPIHPEVFDRLYTDWSTLLKFQRTRGVLRLMATVIHYLWVNGDKSPLILPCSIPMDEPAVQMELTRYLSDNWVPVIEKDVDGPSSLPVRIDKDIPNLGKFSACRRVARTIYLGSAPTSSAAHCGLEDRQIKLGCVMPGESPSVFGDALRRLAGTATYLYQDGTRYWYSTQPTVMKLAEGRAEQFKRDYEKIKKEIEQRVRKNVEKKGDFSRVHSFPQSNIEVPDEPEARLVVLGLDTPYVKNGDNPAITAAKQILEFRGSAPRLYRNMLVFLAADKTRLQDLQEAVSWYLAWVSIVQEKEALNLTPYQLRQAEQQRDEAAKAIEARLPETFQWLLVPVMPIDPQTGQPDPKGEMDWESIRLQGPDPLAVRASRKLRSEELLVTFLAGTRLRMELDRIPLWRGDHVEIKQLVEDFARYIYLPRLQNPAVLVQAVRNGLKLTTWATDTFAYADNFDENALRYRGLRAGQDVLISDTEPQGLLVKPDVATRQLYIEQAASRESTQTNGPGAGPQGSGTIETPAVTGSETPPRPALPRRFYGTVRLDPIRVGKDAGKVAEEVIAHLVALPGARVEVTLEIEATVPDGVPENVQRIVTENSTTLRFTNHGFERE